MGCLNINSLSKHIDELRVYMKDGIFDVLAINETKLDEYDPDSIINLNGYTCIRKDRNKAVYIRNTINFTRKLSSEDKDLEVISIEISKPNSSPFLFTTWYRPPKSSDELFDKFEYLLKKADSKYKEYYILGDLNCDLIAPSIQSHTLKLIDLFDIYQLSQLINEPTRVTENTKTLIDHIITNNKECLTRHGVLTTSISDHNLIFAVRKALQDSLHALKISMKQNLSKIFKTLIGQCQKIQIKFTMYGKVGKQHCKLFWIDMHHVESKEFVM